MPREHTDLIEQAKGCPDIESALEHTFEELSARWKGVSTRNDYGKGTAMGNQLAEDTSALVDAILGHNRVFKMPPKITEQRSDHLTSTPKSAERKYNKDGELLVEPVKDEKAPNRLFTPAPSVGPGPQSGPIGNQSYTATD
jgi:hypothetical protein